MSRLIDLETEKNETMEGAGCAIFYADGRFSEVNNISILEMWNGIMKSGAKKIEENIWAIYGDKFTVMFIFYCGCPTCNFKRDKMSLERQNNEGRMCGDDQEIS